VNRPLAILAALTLSLAPTLWRVGMPAALLRSGTPVASAATTYTITDLGALPGSSSSGATGINASGQVVGWSGFADGNQHAFLWQHGTITDLGTLPGDASSVASSINDAGQVVGWSGTASGNQHAFLWQHGTMTDLGALPGSSRSGALGINDSGQVVGSADIDLTDQDHPFLWQHGTMTALGLLPGDYFSDANAINASGQVVGFSSPAREIGHTVLWHNGTITDLGTPPGDARSRANAINASGQVVGSAQRTYTSEHAVLWTPASSDTTPPVVTVTVPQPTHGLNGWFNAQDALPLNVTVSADDATTGSSTTTGVSCTVNNAPVTLGNVTGLNTPTAQGTLAVSAQGTSTIRCTARDSAGNAGATGTRNTGAVKIDTRAPHVACPSPAPDVILHQPGATLTAAVTDPTPGAGPDPSSGTASASTAQVGSFTVPVTGQDLADNATTVGCADQVSYKIALLDSPTHGDRPAIILQLEDDNNVNQSSASIAVSAVSIVDSHGDVVQMLHRAFTFRTHGPAGTRGVYVYTLRTHGLTRDAPYQVLFTAGTDPVIHAARFTAW
jgi:probable HAF family extracellular repeat protein